VGSEISRDHRQDLANQAAVESSTLAAPDADTQQIEQQAAMEAARTSAPDTLTPIPSDSNFMSGGRSIGDLGDASIEQPSIGTSTQPPSDPVEENSRPSTTDGRPILAASQTQASVESISHLHIPGEFPKGTP